MILMVIALANTDSAPALFEWVDHRLPGSDFTGHFVLMGTLSLLVNLALGARRMERWPVPILRGSLLVATVVTVEECTQIFLVHRSFSLVDLTADLLGIFLFGRLAAWWVAKKTSG